MGVLPVDRLARVGVECLVDIHGLRCEVDTEQERGFLEGAFHEDRWIHGNRPVFLDVEVRVLEKIFQEKLEGNIVDLAILRSPEHLLSWG